jgi:hypothetical protein
MQQMFVTAIKENNTEEFQELLNRATETEKENAALLAAFANKIERLRELIVSGTNINRVDKEGWTCLHWAVQHNNLEMIKLLLIQGAKNQEDKSGKTPADIAEKNNYTDAFQLLVQHFIVESFKSNQDDELIVAYLELQEIEKALNISADTLNLLIKFQIKKQDFDLVKISLEDVERVVNPHFLRKFFRFIVSISIVRAMLLYPFLNKNSIKLDAEITGDDQPISFNHDLKEIPYHTTISEHHDNESFSLILKDIDGEVDALSINSDDIQPLLTQNENDKNNEKELTNDLLFTIPQLFSLKSRQEKKCRLPILTTHALPFESEMTQKAIYGLSAFHITVEEFFDGIWSLLFSSLLIQGVFNFYQYPKERLPYETIARVLGLSSPIGNKYQELLASSLNSPYILAFILGVPVVFGTINAIRAMRDTQALDRLQVQTLLQQLKQHKPGFWSDGLGWIVSAALPDAFPPLAMLALLPQPLIKQVLEKIKQRVLWDGRLSSKDRRTLFNNLELFGKQNSKFTQMKALSMLAAIADGVGIQNLSLLKKEGMDDENIKTLLLLKIRTFHALDFFANHYNLPDAPRSLFSPLFRYVYANYLMWNLGYPQHWYLQPLFFIYRAIKLYFIIQFYYMLAVGVEEIITNAIDRNRCSILPNFVYRRGDNCFERYLDIPRTFEELIKALELLKFYDIQ